MKTPMIAPTFIRQMKQEVVGTFPDRENAKEFRRMLEIGLVHNSLGSTKGRIIQKGEEFQVVALKKGKVLLQLME